MPLMTAKDLLAKGKDDQQVRLQGKLLSHKGGDKYEFADASGRMTVESAGVASIQELQSLYC